MTFNDDAEGSDYDDMPCRGCEYADGSPHDWGCPHETVTVESTRTGAYYASVYRAEAEAMVAEWNAGLGRSEWRIVDWTCD